MATAEHISLTVGTISPFPHVSLFEVCSSRVFLARHDHVRHRTRTVHCIAIRCAGAAAAGLDGQVHSTGAGQAFAVRHVVEDGQVEDDVAQEIINANGFNKKAEIGWRFAWTIVGRKAHGVSRHGERSRFVVAAQNAYQFDPIHLAFVEKYKGCWTRVQIYDSQ